MAENDAVVDAAEAAPIAVAAPGQLDDERPLPSQKIPGQRAGTMSTTMGPQLQDSSTMTSTSISKNPGQRSRELCLPRWEGLLLPPECENQWDLETAVTLDKNLTIRAMRAARQQMEPALPLTREEFRIGCGKHHSCDRRWMAAAISSS
ncbi:hypothetical protein LSTR_LSTR012248 [Laodelphax striatellus]|uniref:Uncharacterized protein n=1 Tax=Laodelphax striatellus TaxID=195883 RepID=A0A482WKX6_LAOST|nr:hypothetical protein LSTR_LSTR012248 [Laodelphax striatellus]